MWLAIMESSGAHKLSWMRSDTFMCSSGFVSITWFWRLCTKRLCAKRRQPTLIIGGATVFAEVMMGAAARPTHVAKSWVVMTKPKSFRGKRSRFFAAASIVMVRIFS